MEIQVVGKIISVSLILFSGMILVLGIMLFLREKSAGKFRYQLLLYSIASAVWGFSYGSIGFLSNVVVAQYVRLAGLIGIEVFVLIDYCAVVDMIQDKSRIILISKHVVAILLIADFIMYSNPNLNTYVIVNGYMTWTGNEMFARSFHSGYFVVLAVIMGTLGIIAYHRYKYRRQKYFLACFYVANLFMLAGSLGDTFMILGYALPLSGLGAIICTLILWIGTYRFSALDASIGNVYNKIYDVIDVGILIFDVSHKLIYVNSCGKSLLGIDDIHGEGLADLFDVTEEKAMLYYDAAASEYADAFHLKTRKTSVDCNGRINIVLDSYKEPYCYTMAIYDITKEVRMLDELKNANAAKEHFLTSMSHEIRTPINAVIGMNEMILRESKEDNVRNYADNVASSGKQLLSIVNDILDFSKIESGTLEVLNSSYDIASLINDSYLIASKSARDKGLKLELSANPDMPSWLYGDEVRIRQIILNLLVNAIKYTDEGFVSWECDYAPIDDENVNLIFSIRDTGRGMKAVDTDSLFKSFTRLDEKKNQTIAGTGLGLSITKSLLDLMGGTISLESIYGVGSRFMVVIPQKVSNEAPVGSITDRINMHRLGEADHKSVLKTSNKKALAVDDVAMNLMVIEELLKETGLEIDTATSGIEALKKCEKNTYDIILMDHMMPEMDGVECMKRIKSECDINSETPIIVITANAVAGARDKYIQEGFDDYLSKPLDGKKLEETIMAHIKG